MSNQYFLGGTRTTVIQAVPKIFCLVNGALISLDREVTIQSGTNFLYITGASLLRAFSIKKEFKVRNFCQKKPISRVELLKRHLSSARERKI